MLTRPPRDSPPDKGGLEAQLPLLARRGSTTCTRSSLLPRLSRRSNQPLLVSDSRGAEGKLSEFIHWGAEIQRRLFQESTPPLPRCNQRARQRAWSASHGPPPAPGSKRRGGALTSARRSLSGKHLAPRLTSISDVAPVWKAILSAVTQV